MNVNKKSGLGFLLIGAGVILLFSALGPGFMGKVMGFLIPLFLIALGYYGIKRGKTVFGWLFLISGIIILAAKLSWILVVLVAFGSIAYGISLLKKQYSY